MPRSNKAVKELASAHVLRVTVNHKRPDVELAKSLMQRLVRNIEPVLAAKKWSIRSLNEMCCCTSHRGPKMNNVQGYCIPVGGGVARTIAVRLRRPGSHAMLSFEECFHTLVRTN